MRLEWRGAARAAPRGGRAGASALMDPTYLVQQAVNSLALGAQYALFAAGLTLIFGVLRILNIAHGAVLMWGALLGLVLVRDLRLPLVAAVGAAAMLAGLGSVVLDRTVFRFLRRTGRATFLDNLAPLVASIGVSIVLVNLAQHVFGSSVWRFPSEQLPTGVLTLGDIFVTKNQLYIIAASCVAILSVHLFIARTRTGKAIRAIAFDKTISSLLGIPVEPTIARVFFLAGVLAGLAGCLMGIAFSVGPFMANDVILKGFAAIILGGMGNLGGSLLAGFIIGLAEVFSITFISSDFKDATTFFVLSVSLLVRPQGLFGRKEDIRA